MTCLHHYMTESPDNDSLYTESMQEQDDHTTINWFDAILHCFQECLLHCEVSVEPNSNKNSTGTVTKRNLVWLELLHESLVGLVALVEYNPLTTMHKLLQRDDHLHGYDYSLWNGLASLLNQSHGVLQESPSHLPSPNDHDAATNSAFVSDLYRTMWSKLQTLATQLLYSAWDDNAELLTALCHTSNGTTDSHDSARWTLLHQALSTMVHEPITLSSNKVSTAVKDIVGTRTMARLYAAGAVMAWQETSKTTLEPDALTQSVSVVAQILALYQRWIQQEEHLKEQCRVLCQAKLAHDQEMQDDALEQEVLQRVTTDQDKDQTPTSQRRQRRARPKPTAAKEGDTSRDQTIDPPTDTMTAMDTNDLAAITTKRVKGKVQGTNAAAIWEAAHEKWHETMQPLQLALELVVNWTSGSSSRSETQDDVDDDDDNDDDDVQMEDARVAVTVSPQLLEALESFRIRPRVVDFLVSLAEWWRRRYQTQPELSASSPVPVPHIVTECLADCMVKAVAAIGHCIAIVDMVPTSQADIDISAYAGLLWETLLGMAPSLASTDSMTDDPQYGDGEDLEASVMAATTNTLVAALQSKHAALFLDRPSSDWQGLLDLLPLTTVRCPEAARDVIVLLGMEVGSLAARSDASLAATCETITRALLVASMPPSPAADCTPANQTLQNNHQQHPSAMVLSEVLNVLMDIYGDDDHDDPNDKQSRTYWFNALGVLQHFQQSMPLLKQKIAVEQLTKNCALDDLEQWKETAMNASRFIQYKKTHL
jgi:hypothetical protein